MALDILSNMANTTLYIVVWSSNERDVKILKVRNVRSDGLVYEDVQIWSETGLVQKFNEILTRA